MYMLHEIFDWQAMVAPEQEVGRDAHGRVLDRRTLVEEANRFAHALIASGVEVGDRVAIVAKNTLDYLIWALGTSKAGAALVPLNFRLTAAELVQLINDAQAKVVVARGEMVDALEPARGELKALAHAVAVEADARRGWIGYEDWIAGQPTAPPDLELMPEADAIQLYTSGTTGLPKGAVLSHSSVAIQFHQLTFCGTAAPDARMLIVLPMFHVAGLFGSLYTLAAGGTLYIMEDFVPAEVVRVLDEEDITFGFLAPAMIQSLMVVVPGVAERAFANLRTLIYGASAITVETLTHAMEVFGCDFAQGFGQTEAGGGLSFLTPSDHRRALSDDRPELLRSCGRALIGTRLKIVDDAGIELAQGSSGEIMAKGPQMMVRYWGLPEKTEAAFTDGWLHTGDVGYLDDEGYLYIQDRLKDMIVSGGENVYPAEVEQALFTHPAVAEVAVIGIPNDQWGEAVHAVVVLRPGATASAEDIIEHTRKHVAGFKRPRSVEFVDALPRNASMKVLKRDLRTPHWAGRDRRV